MTKPCSTCDVDQPLTSYHKRTASKVDGHTNVCKTCCKAYSAKWRGDNVEKLREDKAQQYIDNADRYKARAAQWKQDNRSARNAISAAYRASKLNATPDWLTGTHKAHIKRTYALATMMTEATGVPYHVDHIVPLQGKDICGLHVPWNLQALRADLNMSKSNKHEDDSSYPQVTTTG